MFALAIQLALSFGHFHALHFHDLATPEIRSAAVRQIATAGPVAPKAISSTKQQPAQSDHDPDQQSNDFCAICAVMEMANAVLFPSPPLLIPPQAVAYRYYCESPGTVRLSQVRVAFQPRAPPIS